MGAVFISFRAITGSVFSDIDIQELTFPGFMNSE